MDLKDTVLRALNELVKNGGEGSGDFNHAGNPPHVGGSEPVESRHARGFKSKSERKEVKKEEKNPTFKPVKGIIQTLKDDYEAGKINAKEVAKELSKANLTPYLLDDSEALEKIGVKQSDSKDKQSDSKEKKEDKKVATTKIIEGGIKETTDKYGRIVLSKKHSNKKVKIHKNGNYYLASYGQELKDNDGYTEFQVFPSASGKSFKTEKGAKKWALEKLKETANNSIYKHEYIEY